MDKLGFSSEWDIDQLLASNTVTIGSGDTVLFNIYSSAEPNAFEVEFQPTGSSKWFKAGYNSTNNTLAGGFLFYTYVLGLGIHINTTTAGKARYFVWADKYNYV
jgi:hypothetical protein